jgi:signal transduction histidine kinase
VRARGERGGFVIEVADTGIGIDPEQQQQLFSRAYVMRDVMHHHSSNTLEFRSSGLGLGLAIARGIVEAHEGTISMESSPGEGSVFSIRIPRLVVVRPPERMAA